MREFGKREGGGRRSAARQRAPLPAVISTVDGSRVATLVDISCTGARLRGSVLPRPGEDLVIRIEKVQAFATVVWWNDGECGVTFDMPICAEEIDILRDEAGLTSLANLTLEEKLALDDWTTGKAR